MDGRVVRTFRASEHEPLCPYRLSVGVPDSPLSLPEHRICMRRWLPIVAVIGVFLLLVNIQSCERDQNESERRALCTEAISDMEFSESNVKLGAAIFGASENEQQRIWEKSDTYREKSATVAKYCDD